MTPVLQASFRHISGEGKLLEGSRLCWESPKSWKDWDGQCP